MGKLSAVPKLLICFCSLPNLKTHQLGWTCREVLRDKHTLNYFFFASLLEFILPWAVRKFEELALLFYAGTNNELLQVYLEEIPWSAGDVCEFVYQRCVHKTNTIISIRLLNLSILFWPVKWILEPGDPCNGISSKTQKCVCKATRYPDIIVVREIQTAFCWSLKTWIVPENLNGSSTVQVFEEWVGKKAQHAQDHNCGDLLN